ncbi:MAG: 30S ribosomal protein S9 [Flavobacteriaceae bacterium TMED200]|nr:30S ribosomal protein S9 [Flavobacteriaceae bacterium]OUW66007.1 MAG: 30S ribosomal protein S9 [Flavobacteriaceae bacterium TMED200]|tara:strand:- start:2247 stop:2633 length:387 start_codon:yes stop_codon:yes gene_type:complete
MERIHATGRRKKSIARLFISKGKSEININSKSFEEYFPTAVSQFKLLQPLNLTNNLDQYSININVVGGGVNGQVEAIRLALAKALCVLNEENRKILKPDGLLTRDSRNVERKKYGRKKARKKFQFSKR